MPRPLREISYEIANDWKNPYFGAMPYLEAMFELESLDQMYLHDSARSIVVYFLANAQSWRGPTARRVKAELKAMLKEKK